MPNLTDEDKKALSLYVDNIFSWRECFNLTSSKDKEDFYNNHIVDSLSLTPILKEYLINFDNNINIDFADYGSGCGIPIIPLYITFQNYNINFYSVEQNHKRCVFLNDTVTQLKKELNYKNSVVVLEKQIKELKQKFDIITFCALSPLKNIEKLLFKTLKDNGYIFAYKGEYLKAKKETDNLSLFDAKIVKLENLYNKERCVVILNKK